MCACTCVGFFLADVSPTGAAVDFSSVDVLSWLVPMETSFPHGFRERGEVWSYVVGGNLLPHAIGGVGELWVLF